MAMRRDVTVDMERANGKYAERQIEPMDVQEIPQSQAQREAELLLGNGNMYGIYQIGDESEGREYKFMNLNFMEQHGYQVKKEDYRLVYTDKLHDGDTLDSLYERFNTAHPAGYTGHSLSVSDVVVLNENGDVKAYFVDSLSFRELPDFLQLEQAAGREGYKPLAKVEELEEANYNMIDNVINNLPKKKGPYILYYAAACEEFHDMGAYEESRDVRQAADTYRKYMADPQNVYLGCGLGIIYRDPDDNLLDGAEVGIVAGKTIYGQNIDNVRFLAELPMVHEAMEKIREAFPDFRYIPAKNIRDVLYPEHMETEELAEAVASLNEEIASSAYGSHMGQEEQAAAIIAMELRAGGAHKYISYMKDVVEDESRFSQKAGVLIDRLKSYEPDCPSDMEPMTVVNFCEDKSLMQKGCMKLADADKAAAELDARLYADKDGKTGEVKKTVQIYFTVYYPDENNVRKLQGKFCMGDGNGGIVSHLRAENERKLTDESWLDYQMGKGEEAFTVYMADLTNMQEKILPYLQSFCSLEERAPEKLAERPSARGGRGKIPTAGAAAEKRSIHERIKINKEIIAKQQGKDNREKGVDVAAL